MQITDLAPLKIQQTSQATWVPIPSQRGKDNKESVQFLPFPKLKPNDPLEISEVALAGKKRVDAKFSFRNIPISLCIHYEEDARKTIGSAQFLREGSLTSAPDTILIYKLDVLNGDHLGSYQDSVHRCQQDMENLRGQVIKLIEAGRESEAKLHMAYGRVQTKHN